MNIEMNTLTPELFLNLYVSVGWEPPCMEQVKAALQNTQYTSLAIPFTVYDLTSLTAEVELSVNGNMASRQTVDRAQQVWPYRADNASELALEISRGSVSRSIALTVTASAMEIEAETESLSLYLSGAGRSNTEENPAVWEYGSIAARFSGFNFTSYGWHLDEGNIPVLRVSGDATLTIPAQPFGGDFRTTGKTIEIEFASRDVMNHDTVHPAELAAWLKSTDQSAATGDNLPVNRTYEGVLYTQDTVQYRLAKFKSEFAQHFEKNAVLFITRLQSCS